MFSMAFFWFSNLLILSVPNEGYSSKSSLALRTVWRYQKVPEDTKRYQKIPKGTRRYQKVPEDTKRYQKIPKGTKRYQKVPEDTKRYQKIPKGTRRYQKVPEDTKRYTKRYQKIPKGTQNGKQEAIKRRTYNAMAAIKRKKRQTTIYKNWCAPLRFYCCYAK